MPIELPAEQQRLQAERVRGRWPSGRRTGPRDHRGTPQAAEDGRAAEDARHATVAAVAATADSLHSTLEQMKFLEEARRTMQDLKGVKPPADRN